MTKVLLDLAYQVESVAGV